MRDDIPGNWRVQCCCCSRSMSKKSSKHRSWKQRDVRNIPFPPSLSGDSIRSREIGSLCSLSFSFSTSGSMPCGYIYRLCSLKSFYEARLCDRVLSSAFAACDSLLRTLVCQTSVQWTHSFPRAVIKIDLNKRNLSLKLFCFNSSVHNDGLKTKST